MPIYITNAEADALARELAAQSGETITEVVVHALRDRKRRLRQPSREERIARLEAIADHAAGILAGRKIDIEEMYDDFGAPR